MLREDRISSLRYIGAVLAYPAASQWLKTTLRGALSRHPVDAANDAEMLAALLCDRADRALSGRLANLLRERVERPFAASRAEHRQPSIPYLEGELRL